MQNITYPFQPQQAQECGFKDKTYFSDLLKYRICPSCTDPAPQVNPKALYSSAAAYSVCQREPTPVSAPSGKRLPDPEGTVRATTETDARALLATTAYPRGILVHIKFLAATSAYFSY